MGFSKTAQKQVKLKVYIRHAESHIKPDYGVLYGA